MNHAERKKKFDDFYQKTYQNAMVYCIGKTGDFINGEDLLAEAYYDVYQQFSKDKTGELLNSERSLVSALKKTISQYWEKHRRDLILEETVEGGSIESLLNTDLDLTEEAVIRRMLVQDILEYVSVQPAPLRRAFALYFYLGKTLEETASELKVPVLTAQNYLCRILREIEENFLEEYEQ